MYSAKKLKTHLTIYLDILGLREQMISVKADVRQSEKLFLSYRKALINALTLLEPSKSEGNDLPPPWEHKIFTDNVVLAVSVDSWHGEPEFGTACSRAAAFQLSLALDGWFVRGGMSLGPLFIDDRIVFGPGLVEAYELESQIARDPRIVLSPEVSKLIKSHLRFYTEPFEAPQNGYILLDTDGRPFLNYLYEPIAFEVDKSAVLDMIRIHKRRVERNLKTFRDKPRIWAKYKWLSDYHDFFCQTWLAEAAEAKELLISREALITRPSLLVPRSTRKERNLRTVKGVGSKGRLGSGLSY